MVWIKTLIKSFLLPPGLLFSLFALAFILQFRRKFSAYLLVCGTVFVFFLLSTPYFAHSLMSPLEERVEPLTKTEGAEAIVILGGGQRRNCPEYGGQDCVNSPTLGRIAYGAKLSKQTGLPILVSGGFVLEDLSSEAQLMAKALQDLFSVPVPWIEERSRDTAENAEYSAEMLKKLGIQRILLVTDAYHMRRALLSFGPTRLDVIPAPTNFQNPLSNSSLLNWLPKADAFAKSATSLHEWIGYIWYRASIP